MRIDPRSRVLKAEGASAACPPNLITCMSQHFNSSQSIDLLVSGTGKPLELRTHLKCGMSVLAPSKDLSTLYIQLGSHARPCPSSTCLVSCYTIAGAQHQVAMIKPITAQLKTLLVDDNSTNLRILERTLRHHFSHLVDHGTIAKASDGLAALTACREQSFDLILLDIDMPCMSGVQVAQSIRKTDVDTIIIACTTSDSAEARNTYAEVGMDGCVSKPLDLREVNNAIIHALRTRKYLELFQEMNSPDALDRHLVHRGSVPDATLDRSRKHLVAPRSMSSPYVETTAMKTRQQPTTSEVEISSTCGQESEDEHDDCISLTDDSDVSSNESVTVRTRTASISFSSCACNGSRRVRRPRFTRTVSVESAASDLVLEDVLSTNVSEASSRASHRIRT